MVRTKPLVAAGDKEVTIVTVQTERRVVKRLSTVHDHKAGPPAPSTDLLAHLSHWHSHTVEGDCAHHQTVTIVRMVMTCEMVNKLLFAHVLT